MRRFVLVGPALQSWGLPALYNDQLTLPWQTTALFWGGDALLLLGAAHSLPLTGAAHVMTYFVYAAFNFWAVRRCA